MSFANKKSPHVMYRRFQIRKNPNVKRNSIRKTEFYQNWFRGMTFWSIDSLKYHKPLMADTIYHLARLGESTYFSPWFYVIKSCRFGSTNISFLSFSNIPDERWAYSGCLSKKRSLNPRKSSPTALKRCLVYFTNPWWHLCQKNRIIFSDIVFQFNCDKVKALGSILEWPI